MDALNATRELKRLYPFINILGFTLDNSNSLVRKFKSAGGDGLLSKAASPDHYYEAIEYVSKGGLYFREVAQHPGWISRLLENL